MRFRKKPWAQNELDTNRRFVPDPGEYKGKWNQRFENANPIYAEIGCGRGRFVVRMAEETPGANFVAVERDRKVIVTGARAARERGLNIAFISGDAGCLAEWFGAGEIDRIFINFCDPWPNKNKWAKRRLTHQNYLNIYKKILKSGGSLHFKTDNPGLFEFSINQFSDNGWRLRNVTFDLHRAKNLPQLDADARIMTEYEEKYAERGLPIYRLEASVLSGDKVPGIRADTRYAPTALRKTLPDVTLVQCNI